MKIITTLRQRMAQQVPETHELDMLGDLDSTLSSAWKEVQRVKAEIAAAKEAARTAIDQRYAEQLDAAESKYAIVLKMHS